MTPSPDAEGSSLRRRLSLILLLVIVFGAPALVTTSLLTQEVVGEVTRGAQPGGTIEGTAVDERGDPVAGHAVELWNVPLAGEPVRGASTVTDASGRFELVAEPVEGSYVLRAGGELLQRVVKGISFLDPKGETIQPRPVKLELRTGAVLELDFVLPDGEPAGDGTYRFDGEQLEGGFLFGLVRFPVAGEGEIDAGRLRIDGLPPSRARLAADFDSGQTASLDLEIEPGLNASRIELED